MENKQYQENTNNGYGYESDVDYNNYDNEENDATKKRVRGYRIIIILMTIILIGVSIFSFSLYTKQQDTLAELEEYSSAAINTMESELTSMVADYDSLMVQYDTLLTNYSGISEEMAKAQEMIEQLKNERRLNYNALAKYKKEIESMRGVMKSYLKQIDSLNTENQKLSGENKILRKDISTERLRADKAEEEAKESKNLVKQGAVLNARDIQLTALNKNDKDVSRIKNAKKLRIDFVVSANVLAPAGDRNVYLCLTSPEGYPIVSDSNMTFSYQGSEKLYSAARNIDYQNEDTDVSIFFNGEGFTAGVYKIELYMDDTLIGSRSIDMK